jgi:hypothetical protein
MKFEDFLDYIIIRDKQGNEYPVNKELYIKQYEKIRAIQETQRTRRTRKRKTRKME